MTLPTDRLVSTRQRFSAILSSCSGCHWHHKNAEAAAPVPVTVRLATFIPMSS